MRDAGKEVAAHRVRERNVGLRVGPDQHERRAQIPDLGGPERLENFRTGVGRAAPIEEAGGATAARRVVPIFPPHRRFVAKAVQLHVGAGRRESTIQVDDARGDVRVAAVPHDASGLVLIETEPDKRAQERAGLRAALRDPPAHHARHRIGRARRVGFLVAQERVQIARGREPDAEHERILHGVLELVEACGIDTGLQTNAGGIRSPRKRRGLARCEGPVGARDLHHAGLDALGRFRHRGNQRRLRRIERRRWIRWRAARHQEPGGGAVLIQDSDDERADDAAAVTVARARHLNRLIGGRRHDVALPSADERDVSFRARRRLAVAAIHHRIHQARRWLLTHRQASSK